MDLKPYTYLHYIFEEDALKERNPDQFYLFNPQSPKNPDVHEVDIALMTENPQGFDVPCNILSGTLAPESDEKGRVFERVDAQLGCSPTETISGQVNGQTTKDVGFLTDGSIYSEFGVTYGEDSAPQNDNYFHINRLKIDGNATNLDAPNLVIGQPLDSYNGDFTKYGNFPSLELLVDSSSSKDELALGLNPSEYINSDGALNTTIHLIRGNLKIESWDLYATLGTTDGPAEPCTNQNKDTYIHECNICNGRADFARATAENHIKRCYECSKYREAECLRWSFADPFPYFSYQNGKFAYPEEYSDSFVWHDYGDCRDDPCLRAWESKSDCPYSDVDGKNYCEQREMTCHDGSKKTVWGYYSNGGVYCAEWGGKGGNPVDDGYLLIPSYGIECGMIDLPCGDNFVTKNAEGYFSLICDESASACTEALQNCLNQIHIELDANETAQYNIDLYKNMCFDECNLGDNASPSFSAGHPSFASCKDANYDSDGGRLSDVWHACGKSSSNSSVNYRIPLNQK